ncbi:hypothetical protein BDR26DRAFT_805434, partial [Obelidium mucronatum]
MCAYNLQISSSLRRFVSGLDGTNIDARYAVVAFGGLPSVLVPFTVDIPQKKLVLAKVGCSRDGWEAGLEALRMTLQPNNGTDMDRSNCIAPYTGRNCIINWRPGAQKHIIMATDEDSDIPILNSYLMPGQSDAFCPSGYAFGCGQMAIEPPFTPSYFWKDGLNWNYFRNSSESLVLAQPYYEEIKLTAKLIINSGVSLSLLMKSDFNANLNGPQSTYNSFNKFFNRMETNKSNIGYGHTAIAQYGDPHLQVQDSVFGNFDPEATLENLRKSGIASSLQGSVLANGGIMRVYQIQQLVDPITGPEILNHVYNAIETLIQNCTYSNASAVPITAASTTASTTSTSSTGTTTSTTDTTSTSTTSSTETSTSSTTTSTETTSTSTTTSTDTTTTETTSTSSTTTTETTSTSST